MENWQSIVLLTTGKPQLAADNITRRLTRWTGCTFSGRQDESENFVVLSPPTGMIKLAGEFMFAVTVLERSYFDSEDAHPYLEQAKLADDERLAGLLRSCRGAIIIDAHIIERPCESLHYLAKIAAAMMEQDTPVMLVPPSLVVRAVSGELRSAMGRADDVDELMPHVMNFSAAPEAQGGLIACLTLGMHMLALPNVIMRCCQDQEDVEQCAQAVQSLAAYMVNRRQAVSVGDTTEIASGSLGFLRVVPATRDGKALDPQDAIALEPTAAGDARTAPRCNPGGRPGRRTREPGTGRHYQQAAGRQDQGPQGTSRSQDDGNRDRNSGRPIRRFTLVQVLHPAELRGSQDSASAPYGRDSAQPGEVRS